MKRTNSIFILLAFLLVCLLPASGQAYVQLDDKLYNQLFNGASKSTYNTGAVLIYRGWNKTVGYKTEMIKAIPHMNIVNLTGQTLQIAKTTGVFNVPNMAGQVALMRENTASQIYAYSFDLQNVKSDDYNSSPGPSATVKGDSKWRDALYNYSDSSMVVTVGSDSFTLQFASTNNYNSLAAVHADLVTLSLKDSKSNKYASYLVNNSIVNRGMVYLTGYTDSSSGKPYEVFLVAGDRIRITLLVKYKNT